MGKEWLERPVCWTVELSGRPYGLSPAGRQALRQLFKKVLKGAEAFPSEQRPILDGYTITPAQGLDELKANLGGRTFVFVVNHLGRCPAGAVGNAIYVNYCMREASGKEPRLVLGAGRTIVSAIRKEISQSTRFILTDGGIREILEEVDKGECVGIYPEGGNSCTLGQGSFKSGRFLFHVAERGVSIVCLGITFRDNTFSGDTSLTVDLERVRALGSSCDDKKDSGQRVIDYVMGELARLLPEDLRGYYRGPSTVAEGNPLG